MEQIQRYEIVYTETAVQDIEEKADYIATQLCDFALAENWYLRLKADIQKKSGYVSSQVSAIRCGTVE